MRATEPTDAARIAMACLDLTSLNDADTEADIVRLCARARAAPGPVAALCVWPRFAALARRERPAGVAIAAVANFPDGGTDVDRAVRETALIVESGADEVDVVLPFAAVARGDVAAAKRLLEAVRRACDGLRLKVILETGVLVDDTRVARAAAVALDAGADFLKTSTGRTALGATPGAVRTMLAAIAVDASAAGRVGLKVSGGVRTVADAARYIALVEAALGAEALQPGRFRIGASGLLTDIEAVLAGTRPAAAASGY